MAFNNNDMEYIRYVMNLRPRKLFPNCDVLLVVVEDSPVGGVNLALGDGKNGG